jgi:hypothetical protein
VVTPLLVLVVAALLLVLPFELVERLAVLLSLLMFHFISFLCGFSSLVSDAPLIMVILQHPRQDL